MTLEQARKKRGWSLYAAAQAATMCLQEAGIEGAVGTQSVKNLEDGTTPPLGSGARLVTLLPLLEAYWPDVTLRDLGYDGSLEVVDRAQARRRARSRRR